MGMDDLIAVYEAGDEDGRLAKERIGPLYHLTEASERARALAEAVRVCAPGGVVVAAAMSRWAKPAEYAARNSLSDGEVQRHMLRLLQQGHDADGNAFDRTSYNHDPDQLRAELMEVGLVDIDVVGVEGPLGSFARQDPALNQVAISAARVSEHLAPHLSLHLLARGRLV
jgi:hypothetical protein